jgi:GWxTD domain-containing protein
LGSHLGKYLLLCCALLVWSSPPLGAQELQSWEAPLRSSGALAFDADVYQMEGAADSTRLEICYAFNLKPNGQQDSLELVIHLDLRSSDHVYADQVERKVFARAPTQADSVLRFVDLKKFNLPPDTVSLRLSIEEPRLMRRGEAAAQFLIRDFRRSFSVSDPVFITSLHRPDEQSDRNFLRGGLLMLPNPSRAFSSQHADNALFYFEINGLPYDPSQPGTYDLGYAVTDLVNQEVFAQYHPGLPVASANSARVEKIPLQNLKPGLYRLTVRLLEQKSGQTAEAARYFQVASEKQQESLPAAADEKSLQRLFDQIRYIATREEKDLFNKLDATGKGEFIVRFWLARDPTPGTPENETMVEHFRRLNYAERAFKGGLRADMARIYIQYGPPLETKRMASNSYYAKPVEIWTYGLNGSTEFVFADRTGDGAYILLHSNHPDEISNPGWENEVQ